MIKFKSEPARRALVNDGWLSALVPALGCLLVLAFIAFVGGQS